MRLAAAAIISAMSLSLFACGNSADTEGEITEKPAENAVSEDIESDIPVETEDEDAAREPATITVCTINDIHDAVAEIPDNGVIGLPMIAGIKASAENAILLDAGDATQGQSFATADAGKHVIDVMNAAGYDAMAAGNHDFDYGAEVLLANGENADFPILSANTLKDGEPLPEHHTVVEAGGYNIGIIGLTTTSTATSTNPEKLEGITFENEIETVKSEISELEGLVDAVIIVAHLGDNPLAANITSEELLEGLDDEQLKMIAAVVDGHSHTVEQTDYRISRSFRQALRTPGSGS